MLVRPFIQPISAFNVTNSNGVANICVLGGDIITDINYEIFQNDVQIYSGSVAVTDNGGSEIRTFQIVLNQAMGLANNYSYTIRAWTENATDTSAYSSVQLFSCYTTPSITLKDSNNTTITNGYTFTTQSGTINVVFDKVDNDSPATLNIFSMDIYGVDSNGNFNLVYSSGETHTPFVVPFDNLTPTTMTNPLYVSYLIQWTAQTTQNMGLNGSVGGLICDYSITESGDLISVENDGANGRIKVQFLGSQFSTVTTQPLAPYGRYIVGDEDNLYLGSQGSKFVIYNKATGTFGSVITLHESFVKQCMAIDENNVYFGGEGETGTPLSLEYLNFCVYNKSTENFNFISIAPSDSSVFSMAVDADNVYCGSLQGKIWVYSKANGTFGSAITTTLNRISSMEVDENNIYCGDNNGKFVVYNKSSATASAPIQTPLGSISYMLQDGDNIYCGGNGSFVIYNKTTSTFSSLIQIPMPTGVYWSNIATVDANNLYCITGNSVVAYNKQSKTFGALIAFPERLYNISAINDGNNLYFSSSNYLVVLHLFGGTVRRKEVDGTNENWYTLLSWKTSELVGGAYYFYDYLARSNAVYQYEFVAHSGDDEPQVETVQVLSQFCKSYIADGDKAFELYEEWNVGSYQRNQKSVTYEPYGSKYPFVAYNAVTNYDNGSDTALYRAPSNIGRQYLDSVAQAQYNKELLNFLTNRKVKVRKTYNGEIALVAVLDAVPNNYNSEMGNTLASTTFKWVEVGDFTDEDFKKLGITNSFTLYGD